jgi:EAL domain-containing protein (putative c-di-GMP-specific phosphodiesterase class I)
VETDAQLVLLEQYGCDMVQGYYLGPPSPPDTIHRMLASQAALATV